AILNSQPMGFYQPAQLVRDARRHGVEVRPVDVNLSEWNCTLEGTLNEHGACAPSPPSGGEGRDEGAAPRAVANDVFRCAVRLGFRQIQGLNEEEIKKLAAARHNGYSSIERLAAVAGVSRFTIEHLAEADAFRSLGLDRRAALWTARRLDTIGIKRTAIRKSSTEPSTKNVHTEAP